MLQDVSAEKLAKLRSNWLWADFGALQVCYSGDGGTPPVECLLSPGPCFAYYFDADFDGDIDLADHGDLTTCLAGPEVNRIPTCSTHDLDADYDVDLADHAAFAQCYSGDGLAPAAGCCQPTLHYHDADADGDVDLTDWASFTTCFAPGAEGSPYCVFHHDFDGGPGAGGRVAGGRLAGTHAGDGQVDLSDQAGFWTCFAGPRTAPPAECRRDVTPTGPAGGDAPTQAAEVPSSGTFTLHGRPIDVLSDPDGPGPLTGLVLMNFRNRVYLPQHGRWLQRDPTGYTDGANLYESFASNPTTYTDPLGQQAFDPTRAGFFGASADDARRAQAAAEAAWIARTYGATETEAGRIADQVYRARRYIIRPADFALESRRFLVVLVGGDPNTADPRVLDFRLENELAHLGGGLSLLGAAFNPARATALRLGDPDFYEGFGAGEHLELAILGPLQGAAYAIEGALDIGVGLGNWALDLSLIRPIALNLDPGLDLTIPQARFAEGLFLGTTPRTAAASRFLGGESVVLLATLGPGSFPGRVPGPRIYRIRAGGVLPQELVPTQAEFVAEIAARTESWAARRGIAGWWQSGGGTARHEYAKRLLLRYQRVYGSRGLHAEVRYTPGGIWETGDPLRGSLRFDVVEGSRRSPIAIYDYKFGTPGLQPAYARQVMGIRGFAVDVLIVEVRP